MTETLRLFVVTLVIAGIILACVPRLRPHSGRVVVLSVFLSTFILAMAGMAI